MKKMTVGEVVRKLSARGYKVTCESFLTNGWIGDAIVVPRFLVVKVTAIKFIRDNCNAIIGNEGYIFTWRNDKPVTVFRANYTRDGVEESKLVDAYNHKDIENTLWQWVKNC